jgi:hypothetical protein
LELQDVVNDSSFPRQWEGSNRASQAHLVAKVLSWTASAFFQRITHILLRSYLHGALPNALLAWRDQFEFATMQGLQMNHGSVNSPVRLFRGSYWQPRAVWGYGNRQLWNQ